MSISKPDPLTDDQVEEAKRLANVILDACSDSFSGGGERVVFAGIEFAAAMLILTLVKDERQEASAEIFYKNLLMIIRANAQ